jgi:uncharacterized protein
LRNSPIFASNAYEHDAVPVAVKMNMNALAPMQALAGGVLIGLATWLLLASLGRIAGISGIAASAIAPSAEETGSDGAWRWAFLLGLIGGGALFSAWLQPVATSSRPILVVILAGLLVGVGTVMGAGCTSGHGVCGLGRRSTRSLAATLIFMFFGAATVAVVHAVVGRSMF